MKASLILSHSKGQTAHTYNIRGSTMSGWAAYRMGMAEADPGHQDCPWGKGAARVDVRGLLGVRDIFYILLLEEGCHITQHSSKPLSCTHKK